MSILFIILLVLLLVGGLPNVSPIQHQYGYFPSGIVGILLIVLLVLLLTGRL